MSRYIRSISKIPQWLIAGLLIYVPFHAFLSVWLASFIGHYTALRLLPEVVLGLVAIWAVVRLAQSDVVRTKTLATPLSKVLLIYFAVIVVLSIVAYFRGTASPLAFWYGLLLTVRPVVWFAAVWVFATESQWLCNNWQRFVITPLLVVASFAIAQFFVLPSDFLGNFGYIESETIAPSQAINQDTDTARSQATLRGPNSLGAYLAISIALVIFMSIGRYRMAIILFITALALFLSFSRASWMGAVAAVGLAVLIKSSKEQLAKIIVAGFVIAITAGVFAFTLRNNDNFQFLIYHTNSNSTAEVTSNEAHDEALRTSTKDILEEPLGRGPGTAGPASVYNELAEPRNSESYLRNIGQEYGWLGLASFSVLLSIIGLMLFLQKSRLGYAMFISLIGLTIINLFSYAWADTTIVYLWWGLAGIAVAGATKPLALDVRLRRLFAPARQTYARIKPSRKGLRQFLYFNIGGAVFFGVGYVLFALLYGIAGWHWFAAKIIADLVGWTLNYLVQHYLAFQDTAKTQGHRSVLAKFIPFSLVNLALDYGIVAGLAWLGVSPFIGLVVSSMFFTVWKWLGYKHWVFRLR